MNNKPVDLGALQDALMKAHALVRSTSVTQKSAASRVASANAVFDAAKERHEIAQREVMQAKQALTEGARQVASST